MNPVEIDDVPVPVRSVLDAWVAGDVDALVAAFADDFRASDPTARCHGDRAKLVRIATEWIADWSDRTVRYTHVVGDQAHVAVGYVCTMTGVSGTLAGHPVELSATTVARTDGEHVDSWRTQYDTAVLRRARRAAGATR